MRIRARDAGITLKMRYSLPVSSIPAEDRPCQRRCVRTRQQLRIQKTIDNGSIRCARWFGARVWDRAKRWSC